MKLEQLERRIVLTSSNVILMPASCWPIETTKVNITVETPQTPLSGSSWHLCCNTLYQEIVIERHKRHGFGQTT
jgi:hypothetical protein